MTLLSKLSALTGPDREVDGLIAAAVGVKHGPDSGFCNSENGDYWAIDECAPLYSASIDAAMTLVPEGCTWSIDTMDGEIEACVHGYGPVPAEAYHFGATPAIALCIAALKARDLT